MYLVYDLATRAGHCQTRDGVFVMGGMARPEITTKDSNPSSSTSIAIRVPGRQLPIFIPAHYIERRRRNYRKHRVIYTSNRTFDDLDAR